MIRLFTTLLITALCLAAWTPAQSAGADDTLSPGGVDLDPWMPESPVFQVEGSCPGPLLLHASGLTPAGQVVFAGSLGHGTSVIASGSCAGTVVALQEPRVIAILRADFLGEAGFVATMPRTAACGAITLQALDLATCTATQPVRL